MDCFGDIVKHNNNFDKTLNTRISRFNKCKTSFGKVLITESVNLVANYDTSDGMVPLESWSFPQLNRLSFPVITYWDARDGTEYLMAVQEPNSLTKWSFGERKGRLEKHFFNSQIIGLIGFDVFENGDRYLEPIVVYSNGFCQSMTKAIESRREDHKQVVISEEESIEFIDGLRDNRLKDNLIIYLITKSIVSKKRTIKSIYKLTISIETDAILKTEKQSVMNSLSNWSLCRPTAAILAVSTSVDGLLLYSLNGKTETQLFKLNSSSIESVVSIGATSLGSVCLIGKTKDSNFLMELWELRYGSKLGQIGLPYEPMTNDCKVIDDSILITCFRGIVSIPIKTQRLYLSQIVGKIKPKDTTLDSDLKNQLTTVCNDFKSNTDQSFDEINERFARIVGQMNGNVPEDLILQLLSVCSLKLTQTESQSLKEFFEKLVSLPFNELFMISKLKASELKFEQILLSLKLLSELLPSANGAIIDWISILIDSHMNQFIMNPNEDIIKVIVQIEQKIENFGEFYEQMGQIKALFDIIVAKNTDKTLTTSGLSLPKPKKGQYCIELLKF